MTIRPNFLIIGAARSGTTAAASALSQHPEVFMTSPKETHFFAYAEQPVTHTGPGDDEMFNSQLVSDPSDYLDLFRGAADYTARGEGSVSTIFRPDVSIEAIHRFADRDVRLLVLLREPTSRAYSSYLYLRARGFETATTFDAGLRLEPERTAQGFHHMWRYEALSRYRDQLPRFRDAFGDRLQVHIFEEFRANPETSLREMCDFLEIDPAFRFDTSLEVNRGGEPRSQILSGAMRLARSSPVLRSAIAAITPYRLRERVRSANLRQPVADDATLSELRLRCRRDVEAVQEILGRTIPSWTAT